MTEGMGNEILADKKKRNWLWTGMGVAMLLWCISFYYGNILAGQYNSESVRFFDSEVEKEALDRIIRDANEKEEGGGEDDGAGSEGLPLICAYKRAAFSDIGIPNSDRMATAAGTEVFGEMGLLMPFRFLSGNFTPSEDYEGCIVSRKLAYRLWGNTDAVGLSCIYKGKTYLVRGVFDSEEALIYVRGWEESATYDCMELRFEDMENAGYRAEEFLLKNGIMGKRAIIDSTLVEQVLKIAYLLSPCLFVFWAVCAAAEKIGRVKSRMIRAVFGMAAILLFLAALKLLFRFGIRIPESLIPTKWSDFDFYVEAGKNIGQGFGYLERMAAQAKESLLQKQALYSMLAGTGSFGIFLACKRLFERMRQSG